ncbi:MAG: UDP-N-acetylmuramate dehydrogenase [Clostridia bacterium]|nr:UDP-N-acetylmuramate dehydrogenase [Clostridia bacterium]
MKKIKKIEYRKNQDLRNYCTFRIGGIAKHLYIAKSKQNLIDLINYCTENKKNFKVIGLGANLLFDFKQTNKIIIVNRSNRFIKKDNSIYVSSGMNLSEFISKCASLELSGMSDLAGIPATIGGAIVNNVGAFNSSISDYIDYVVAINKNNPSKIIKIPKTDCKFGYRKSIFQSGDFVILSAKFSLPHETKNRISKDIIYAIKRKNSSQPLDFPSAGSIFKRGKIIPAKAIDELGLKGLKIGGAMISPKHAGYIINTGNATSKDVIELINLIEKRIFDTKNVQIEREIEIVKK